MAIFSPEPAPGGIPPEQKQLLDWIQAQLENIRGALAEQDNLQLVTLYAAPAKPREGMVVMADGTTWNPGSGVGVYVYASGSWTKL